MMCWHEELDVKKLYLCNYGENALDLPVVDYNDYKKLHKQFQQVKADSERLCTAIRNELHDQYDKRVSDAESDIAWGVLDRNATEAEFCKHVIYETRNYIAKLKQENEELKDSLGLANKYVNKYKQCLDECLSLIEKEVNPYDTLLIIKNNIKEVLNYE